MNVWIDRLKMVALPDVNVFFNSVSTIAVLIILWLIHFLVNRIVAKKTEDQSIRYSWRKISGYILIGISLILVIRLWFQGFQSIVTILGLVAAAIVIIQKETIMNLTGVDKGLEIRSNQKNIRKNWYVARHSHPCRGAKI